MVSFKNRYMVMEIFVDPNKDLTVDDPIIITQFNVAKSIKDSMLVNFGECGLASSLGSFQSKLVLYFFSGLCHPLKLSRNRCVHPGSQTLASAG